MPKLTVNKMVVEIASGSTVLDAAESVSVEIPTLCHMKDCDLYLDF